MFGDQPEHLTEHQGTNLKSILLDSYKDANVDPSTIEYVEAYGSGIKVGIDNNLRKIVVLLC